ncbi:MAG: CsgG/HfaB family protein [Fulvivirga sp.]
MKILVLLLMGVFWLSITGVGQKRLLKDAAALENQGRHEEAFAKYVEAMHRNTTKQVTRDGMIRCSIKLTDEWLSDFLILKGNYGNAYVLKLIKQIERHQKQLEYFGIKSTLNESNRNELESYKKSTLSLWYTNAVRSIEGGNYERAGDLFSRIIEVDENFKDAKIKAQEILKAPVFKEAKVALEHRQISRAWQLLTQIQPDNIDYFEAQKLMKRIKESHKMTICVIESHGYDYSLREAIIAALSARDSPFIQLVERSELSVIIDEQKLGISGLLNDQTAAEVGELTGAESILLLNITNYYMEAGTPSKVQKTAYKKRNIGGLIEYEPVFYSEFIQNNRLFIALNIKLVSTERGEILHSDLITHDHLNSIRYAEYNGSYAELYPVVGDLIYKSGPKRIAFLKLFESKNRNISSHKLEADAQQETAKKVANSVENYLNSSLESK